MRQVRPYRTPYLYAGRVRLLQILGVLAFVLVACKLAVIQLLWHTDYAERAIAQFRGSREIPAMRGTISDRNNRLLATEFSRIYRLIADTDRIGDARVAASILERYTGVRAAVLQKRLQKPGRHMRLAENVSESTRRSIEALGLKGLRFERTGKRYYPHGSVAGNILGPLRRDGMAISGIEMQLDSVLRGTPGKEFLVRNASGKPVENDLKPRQAALPGADVQLTIDQRYQAIAEEELGLRVEKYNAMGGQVIVLDPLSGELLALASWPPLDPNSMEDWEAERARMKPVESQFEPGSTMKMITFAALLENNTIADLDRMVPCYKGRYRIANRTIRDSNRYGYDSLTVSQVFSKSSNIGTVVLAQELPKEALYRMIRRFGLCQCTGIGMPNEACGDLPRLGDWGPVEYANISMGQGLAINGLQLAAAFAVIANEGQLMRPHIIKRIQNSTGDFQNSSLRIRKVLPPRTLSVLRQLMLEVVENGTGKKAAVKNCKVYGKTGTAQKVDSASRSYSNRDYVASFAGICEGSRRSLVCLALLDTPRGKVEGGIVAAPLFSSVMTRIQELERNEGDTQLPLVFNSSEQFSLPDLRGMPAASLKKRLSDPWMSRLKVHGTGKIATQSLPAGSYGSLPSILELYCETVLDCMPNLAGVGAREALRQLSPRVASIKLRGEGRVQSQIPAEGTPLTQNSTVELVLRP